MRYEISVAVQQRRPIAVVAATTTWERFPGQWPGMLDEVYACLSRAGVKGGCNVMLYRDLPEADQVGVEVGVEVDEPFPASGMVVMSALLRHHPLRSGRQSYPGSRPGIATGRTPGTTLPARSICAALGQFPRCGRERAERGRGRD